MKIEVKNLNVSFDNNQILKNINLKINQKSVMALIGPSGCGKSTFLRSINRMNDLTDGFDYSRNIFIDGIDVYSRNVYDLRKSVGMVFQKPNPFPMSIFDNVAYGLKIHGVCEDEFSEIVEKSLKQAALWDEVCDKLDKSSLSLSGGQQQRLCIARTIAVNPDVILMDEPCSALDPISTIKIEKLINDLKENYTIVVVTHNMQQAKRASDYTSFFLNGEIVESGLTCDIFNDPMDERTADYISGRFG